MRITGGKYLGMTVKVEKGSLEIRPAMDRMRESIFAVLGDLSGSSFCDLFSGSGIIALEAASRGANPVVCVEKDPDKRRNLVAAVSQVEERIQVKIQPVELYLKRTKDRFDVIFCDPPFPYAWKADLVRQAAASGIVKPGGLFLIHYPREDRLGDDMAPFRLEDKREYGRSNVNVYRNPSDSAAGTAKDSAPLK